MSKLTERIYRLQRQSMETSPFLCGERAKIVTAFYREVDSSVPTPIARARAFKAVCAEKAIHIFDDELIVGDRASSPKGAITHPEISCHSMEDLKMLRARNKSMYRVGDDVIETYQNQVIPFWTGKSLRERAFAALPSEWQRAYAAGVFTEFLEQRAPGHTVADGKIYHRGFLAFKRDIALRIKHFESNEDDPPTDQLDQLKAMDIACDAILILARRYAEKAKSLAKTEPIPERRSELLRIAKTCTRVPAKAPTSFVEALQMYWFVHLGVILELNGWDAFSPGHLDQHLLPFYTNDLKNGTLDRDRAKELICSLWLKFNNQPAPPKVGITFAESGTYNDFVNINLGGLNRDGTDGANEVSDLILDVVDDLPFFSPERTFR